MKQILRKKKGILKCILAVFALVLMLSFAFLVPCAAAYDLDGAMDVGGVPTIEEGLAQWLGEYGENEHFVPAVYNAGYQIEEFSSVLSSRIDPGERLDFRMPEWDNLSPSDSFEWELSTSAFFQFCFPNSTGNLSRYTGDCSSVCLQLGAEQQAATGELYRPVRLYFRLTNPISAAKGYITDYMMYWKAVRLDDRYFLSGGSWFKRYDYVGLEKNFSFQSTASNTYGRYYVTIGFRNLLSTTPQYINPLLAMGANLNQLDDSGLPDLRWYDLTAYKDGYISASNGMLYDLGYRQGANDTSEEYYTQGFNAGMQDAFNTGEAVLRTVSHMFEAPYRFFVTWLDIELFGISIFSLVKMLFGSLIAVLIGSFCFKILRRFI